MWHWMGVFIPEGGNNAMNINVIDLLGMEGGLSG
jgi:hypothetical protein